MVITFDAYSFEVGQTFYVHQDAGTITLVDAFYLDDEPFVTLRYDKEDPEVMKANVFANYITTGVYIPSANVESFAKPGDRFIHSSTNSTISIVTVSPRISEDVNTLKYFVSMINARGVVSYTVLDERYLQACIPYELTVDGTVKKLPQPVMAGEPIAYTFTIEKS